jgi:hypothetical protein
VQKLESQRADLAKTMTDFTTYKTIDKFENSLIQKAKHNSTTHGFATPQLGLHPSAKDPRPMLNCNSSLAPQPAPLDHSTSYNKQSVKFDFKDFKGVMAGDFGQRRGSHHTSNNDSTMFLP